MLKKYYLFLLAIIVGGVGAQAIDDNAIINELLISEGELTANTNGDEIRFLLRPQKSAILSSKMDGNIVKLSLLPGSKFKKGSVLVKQECDLFEAERNFYQEDVKIQRVKHKTSQSLFKKKSVGKLEYLVNKYTYEKALAQSKSALSKSKLCVIKAPFSGVVSKVMAKKHEHVKAGTQLVEIFDSAAFEIHMIVPSSWLSWLKKNHVFKIKIDETGTTHRAEVKRIEPRIDSVSKTVPIVGVLIDEPKLKYYGMSGTALFEMPKDKK